MIRSHQLKEKIKGAGLQKYAHLGMTIGGSIAGMSYLGYYIDTKFDTSPIFVLLFFVWGFAGTIIYLMRFIKTMEEENKE